MKKLYNIYNDTIKIIIKTMIIYLTIFCISVFVSRSLHYIYIKLGIEINTCRILEILNITLINL